MAGPLHLTRFDPDGNTLTVVSDPHGRVHIEVENETAGPRRAHQATIDSTDVVELVHALLVGVQSMEGSDAVDQAIIALQPYADERARKIAQAAR